jgi:NitT/TauT family transport system permease protein
MTIEAVEPLEQPLSSKSLLGARQHLASAAGPLYSLTLTLAGVAGLLALWQLGGWLVASDARTAAFAGFAPLPALTRLVEMTSSGDIWRMTGPSLWRVGSGLLWAIVIGVPAGIVISRSHIARQMTNLPFQFLRMISPLAWMPVAVLAFSTWESAIVFLIAVAAVWPVLFSTAAGVRRIDPAWLKVARNLGAGPRHILTAVILPAISQDILTGVRLALGVGWIVLVPAEYLGVKSGLGYAINDARDTLDYDRLAATVLVIGAIGFVLDAACLALLRRFSWQREQ